MSKTPPHSSAKAICPLCNEEVQLSVFDLFLQHGTCINAGYTVQEAQQLPRPKKGGRP